MCISVTCWSESLMKCSLLPESQNVAVQGVRRSATIVPARLRVLEDLEDCHLLSRLNNTAVCPCSDWVMEVQGVHPLLMRKLMFRYQLRSWEMIVPRKKWKDSTGSMRSHTGWWGQARRVHNISSTELQVVVAARGQSSTYSYTDSSSEGRRRYFVKGIYYLLVLPPLDLLLHFAETLCISSQNVWFHVQNMWVQLLQHLSECVGHILETTDGVWKNLFTFRLNFPPCIRISYLISSQLLLSSCTHFISLSFFYL